MVEKSLEMKTEPTDGEQGIQMLTSWGLLH